MKFNITKRDLKVFILGILTALAIGFIINWEDNMADIKDGTKQGKLHYEESKNN